MPKPMTPVNQINFNKPEFIASLAEHSGGLPKRDVETVMDSFFNLLGQIKEYGGSITLVGKFSVKQVIRSARKGRNPHNGEAIDIPAKKRLKIEFRG